MKSLSRYPGCLLLLVFTVLGVQNSLIGAVAIIVSIGDIEGGNTQAGREGKIDGVAYSWSISNSKTLHDGIPAQEGVVTVQDLQFSKYTDKATPLLLEACAVGTVFPEATIDVWEPTPTGQEVIALTITMTNVVVTSVETTDKKISSVLDRVTELVTLNFAEVEIVHVDLQDPVGIDIVSITP